MTAVLTLLYTTGVLHHALQEERGREGLLVPPLLQRASRRGHRAGRHARAQGALPAQGPLSQEPAQAHNDRGLRPAKQQLFFCTSLQHVETCSSSLMRGSDCRLSWRRRRMTRRQRRGGCSATCASCGCTRSAASSTRAATRRTPPTSAQAACSRVSCHYCCLWSTVSLLHQDGFDLHTICTGSPTVSWRHVSFTIR